ncbi:hypothetical protein MRBLWO14_001168 [Microbacterium sp. LWO14-1.2]|uniref:hypothetical protein n=1 Tax=Microbacterium sp. LWO14-1.2 TaxID=3135263 RepID=UPI0031394F47
MSVRKEIETQLKADWADIAELAGVRVIATERELDDITVPTALIRGKSFALTPQAPLSHRNVGLLVTLISPHLDLDRAGDQLDDIVTATLDYLDARYSHDDATAVGYGARLAYDIPFTVIASKE